MRKLWAEAGSSSDDAGFVFTGLAVKCQSRRHKQKARLNTKNAVILAALMGLPVFGIPIYTHQSEDVFEQVSALNSPATGGVVTITNVPINGTFFPSVPPRAISLHLSSGPQSVPETAETAALLCLGVAGLALARRRLS